MTKQQKQQRQAPFKLLIFLRAPKGVQMVMVAIGFQQACRVPIQKTPGCWFRAHLNSGRERLTGM
ncbi:hypothetical protein C7H09_17775 [Marinobacter fuscus]|uniref:Uncharacterized protein n=1 Tax=Marinobacter fuscus TaxID=2109942 RepID=A0A2T1K5T8_9GAMM|nr:hypothetical protein C7H09_17775 [Marinobacter fuscus]